MSAEKPPPRLLVADSQRLFAESLAIALRMSSFEVVDEHPTSGFEAGELVVRQQPDVALIDHWMTDMNGPAITRTIRSWAPRTKVILLSWFHNASQIEDAILAGVDGYLPKSLRFTQLVEAIHRTWNGESPVYAQELHRLVGDITQRGTQAEVAGRQMFSLTPREVQILHLLNQGLAAKQVAQQLTITVGTVKNHIHKILAKTETSTQAEAIAMARRARLVRDDQLPPHPPHQGPHWVG